MNELVLEQNQQSSLLLPSYLEELTQGAINDGDFLTGFTEDAVRIAGSDIQVRHATVIDTFGDELEYADKPHRDAFQLIPPWIFRDVVIPRPQYAAGLIENLLIESCHIRSHGQLQGIFCSDGRVRNITIYNNVIQTNGYHYISLSGVQSGYIEGNVREDGTPCPVHFWPLRIGGNSGAGTVCVVGYSNPDYNPLPLEEIMPDSYERFFAKDRRTLVKPNPHVTYLSDFHLDEYQEALLELDAPRDVALHTFKLQELAKQYGSRVYAA